LKPIIFLLVVTCLASFTFALERGASWDRSCNAGTCTLSSYVVPVNMQVENGTFLPFTDVVDFSWSGNLDGGLNLSWPSGWVLLKPFIIYNGQYRTLQQIKTAYPSVVFKEHISKNRGGYKWALNFTGIPDSVKNKVDFIGLDLVDSSGITWNDVELDKNNSRLVFFDKVQLGYGDLLDAGFTLNFTNKTRLLIGNVSGKNDLWLDPTTTQYNLMTGGAGPSGWVLKVGTSCGASNMFTSMGNDTSGSAWPVASWYDFSGLYYLVYRTYYSFNTNEISDSAVIDAANITVSGNSAGIQQGMIYGGGYWGETLYTNSWGVGTTNNTEGVILNDATEKTIPLLTSFINKTGYTQFEIISDDESCPSDELGENYALLFKEVDLFTPYLNVTYTLNHSIIISNASLNETNIDPNELVFFNSTIIAQHPIAHSNATWRYSNGTTKNVSLSQAFVSGYSTVFPTVQEGFVTFASGSTTATVILGTAINTSQSFVICNGKTDANAALNLDVFSANCEIANSTGVNFTRYNSGTAVTYSYRVVSSPNLFVQRGKITSSTGFDSAILSTAVNTSAALPIISARVNSAALTRYNNSLVSVDIVNSTGVNFQRYSNAIASVYAWEVVEFKDGTFVQKGTVTGNPTQTPLVGIITAVGNTSKTWLHYNYNSSSNTIDATAVAGNLTNSTAVRFWRWGAGTTTAGITYYVAEFPPTSSGNVQRGSVNVTSNTATASVVSITAVNSSRAWGYVRHVASSGTGANMPRNEWISYLLPGAATTSLFVNRTYTGVYASFDWQVVELPTANVSTPTATDFFQYTFTETDATGWHNVTAIYVNYTNGDANSTAYSNVGVYVSGEEQSLAFSMSYPTSGCTNGNGSSNASGICVRCFATTTDLQGPASETGVGCEGQTSGTAFFAFTNEGNVAEAWTMSLNSSLGATLSLNVDTDNTYAGAKNVNATTPLVVNASIPVGTTDYVWAWIDFIAAGVATTVRGVFSNSTAA